jgi:hypothetical protein
LNFLSPRSRASDQTGVNQRPWIGAGGLLCYPWHAFPCTLEWQSRRMMPNFTPTIEAAGDDTGVTVGDDDATTGSISRMQVVGRQASSSQDLLVG